MERGSSSDGRIVGIRQRRIGHDGDIGLIGRFGSDGQHLATVTVVDRMAMHVRLGVIVHVHLHKTRDADLIQFSIAKYKH